MVSSAKGSAAGPLPIPTSRISRLFRPYLTKLASLDALFLSAPGFIAPIATRSMRTYSKADLATQYTGAAEGLPVFERGQRMKRATPRAIPKELLPVPPPPDPRKRRNEKQQPGSKLPQLPNVEMAEISKRVYAIVQAFNNILDVVYPVASTPAAGAGPVGIEALGALCARRVGENMEVWIDRQLEDEFEFQAGSDDEISHNVESRRLELRDEWWEGVPEHWRRFAVPVHALTIAIGMDVPIHGLYEALLDACIARCAVYEVALLLPHMIHHAYTLSSSATKSPPGSSYLPTLSRKVSTTSPTLGSRWSTIVNKATLSVHNWLDYVAGDERDQERVERRWLGDAMDGLVRESRDAAGAALVVDLVRTVLDHPDRESISELFVQRLSAWSQYTIFLSNTLRQRDPASGQVAAIDASLKQLADLLHNRLSPIDLQPIATALLALDLHSLWTNSLAVPSEDPNTLAVAPRLPEDKLQFCFIPHILSSHVSISSVFSLTTTLRLIGTLPTIETGILQCAIAEYDRLSLFADSTILSPEEQQMAALGLEELSDLATDAEKRRLALNIADGGTPGGSAKGMRWEEMVGAWVEATPQGRPERVIRRRVELSPLTDEESASEEGEESDDPMDALDGSSDDGGRRMAPTEVRGLKRMGRMSLDGPSSVASDEDQDDEPEDAAADEGLDDLEEDSEPDQELDDDGPEHHNFVREDSTAAPSSSTAVPLSSPCLRPARLPTKRPRSSPHPAVSATTRFPPIPPQPLFISSNPKLNAQSAVRDRRLSQLMLIRPHPSRRTHTSLPEPTTGGATTPIRAGKAPPPWLHSRFSPAAGSPLRRLSVNLDRQRAERPVRHSTAALSLVPHSPSPLQSTPHGASRLNAAAAQFKQPYAPTSAHKYDYTHNAPAQAAPIVLLSSSPSKFGSSPVKKKTRRATATQLPPSSDPAADPASDATETEIEMEPELGSAPPSSEADDMDLFAASSPVLPTRTTRTAGGVLKMGGMREKLGRKRVGWGLTREEV